MEGARAATAEDLDRLAELARDAIAELSQEKGGLIWQRHAARLEPVEEGLAADLADGDTQVVVGTLDDAVVAYSVTSVEELADHGRLAVIRDLYVTPDARGVGVGATVMDAVLAWATVGEIAGRLRRVFGEHRETLVL